jgi:hypothetical protein
VHLAAPYVLLVATLLLVHRHVHCVLQVNFHLQLALQFAEYALQVLTHPLARHHVRHVLQVFLPLDYPQVVRQSLHAQSVVLDMLAQSSIKEQKVHPAAQYVLQVYILL